MKLLVLTCCVLLFACSGWSQDADIEHRQLVIGEINYFGYGGLQLQKVRAALPCHVGDTLSLVEGASWADVPDHSSQFLMILGRIGEIPDIKFANVD